MLEQAVRVVTQAAVDGAGVPVERMQGKPVPKPSNEITCPRCGGSGKAAPKKGHYPKLCGECLGHGKLVL